MRQIMSIFLQVNDKKYMYLCRLKHKRDMQFTTIPCHESLRPFIRNYWFLDTYCTARGTQQVFSNGAACLHFYTAQAVRLGDGERMYRSALNSSDMGRMEIVTEQGKFCIFGVEFVPFCVHLFFRSELLQAHSTPEDLDDAEFALLSKEILATDDNNQRTALLDDFFCGRLADTSADDINIGRMDEVFQEIVPTDGSDVTPPAGQEEFTPSDLASMACVSQKQFTRVFNKYVGMNPKAYLRLLRFHKALMMLQQRETEGLTMTEVAWRCGYTDLAHMINDFRSLSGHSPKEILAASNNLSEAFSPKFSGLMKKKIINENLV